MCEVPGWHGRVGLEGLIESRDARVVRTQVRGRVSDVRPIEHRVVEGGLVLDRLALDRVAGPDVLDRDVRPGVRRRKDLEELERQDPAVRERGGAVGREVY